MRSHYTLARLYWNAPLSADMHIALPREQAHYLGTVLRKGAGDAIRIFNGRDGEWRAELTDISKRAASLTLKEQLRAPQICPDVTLCFAPVKKHRTAFIIEKAAELGVRTLQPVITERTQFPKLNLDRARAQAVEASEQTERLDIPVVNPPVKLPQMITNWDAARPIIFADEAGDAPRAIDALKTISAHAAILIGPEGGFSNAERDMLRTQDFVHPVNLGPRILRADTAALSVLTLWQALRGDWT